MGKWYNADGLIVKFGTTEAEPTFGGEYRTPTSTRIIEFEINAADLEAFGTPTFLSDTVKLPNGVLLEAAEFVVLEAFTSAGAATLTFGLYDDDEATAYDADGIDAAIALTAIDTVGEKVTCDGALVGTVLANNTPSYVAATVGAANYTAGKGVLRLHITYFA